MTAPEDELAARARARLGTVLNGKYRLDRVLGVGGMATVFAATHRNGKEVAVKILHSELALNGEVRTRFLREGYVANSVKHRGAVDVADDDVAEDGAAFTVMELLEGETLEDLWEKRGGFLPLDAVVGIAFQCLDVLSAAHERSIVHRDIKPANLFLTRDGQVKVLDFGIARLRDVAAAKATQSGMMLGTPAFMAPEQAAGRTSDVDPQSDLWAVGACMFTLASGRLVHDGDNAQQIMIRAAMTPAASFASVMPEAPAALVAVIDRALAFEKGGRWETASAMRAALREASLASLGEVRLAPSLAELVVGSAGDARPPEARAPEPGAPRVTAAWGDAAEPMKEAPPPSAFPRPPAAALVTGEPVSNASPAVPGAAPPPPRSRRLVVGMGVALLASLLGAALALTYGHTQKELASAPEAMAVATTAEPSAASVTPARSTVQTTDTSAPEPSAEVDQRSTSAAPASAATVAPPSPRAPPAKSRCASPYDIDSQGHKKWKRECL
jgi:eukaryotic-like serine/threonine-protein kinase